MAENPALPRLKKRLPESHKGDYGRVILVGGSRGMSGAIGLSGMAALRSGAGLVKLAVPDVSLETVALYEPSYMTTSLQCDAKGRIALEAHSEIVELIETADAVGIGPGLGRSEELTELVARLYREAAQPFVLDADALNALAVHPQGLERPGGPRIITPHPGEFARLVGEKLRGEAAIERAMRLAREHQIVVVLKGHRTLVTDGRQQYRNPTGNPGMATGGTGDVLTGILTALIGQGLAPFAAAQLGVYVHGLAGDLAAEQLGETSLIARDLIEYLPKAFRRVEED